MRRDAADAVTALFPQRLKTEANGLGAIFRTNFPFDSQPVTGLTRLFANPRRRPFINIFQSEFNAIITVECIITSTRKCRRRQRDQSQRDAPILFHF